MVHKLITGEQQTTLSAVASLRMPHQFPFSYTFISKSGASQQKKNWAQVTLKSTSASLPRRAFPAALGPSAELAVPISTDRQFGIRPQVQFQWVHPASHRLVVPRVFPHINGDLLKRTATILAPEHTRRALEPPRKLSFFVIVVRLKRCSSP